MGGIMARVSGMLCMASMSVKTIGYICLLVLEGERRAMAILTSDLSAEFAGK